MPNRRTGRPSKYNDEIKQRLCTHLSYGATNKMAAEAEGIHEDTFTSWLIKHQDFLAAVTEAKARARTDNLRAIYAAATRGNVKAATWLLERLEPEAFGPRPQKLQLSGALDIDITSARERLSGLINRIAARVGTPGDTGQSE